MEVDVQIHPHDCPQTLIYNHQPTIVGNQGTANRRYKSSIIILWETIVTITKLFITKLFITKLFINRYFFITSDDRRKDHPNNKNNATLGNHFRVL